MKITSFGVNNFRGIHGGLDLNTINFDNSNTIFLFGQNNVGKSTFLHAYEFFYYNRPIKSEDFHKQKAENIIEFELEVEMDSTDLERVKMHAPKKIGSLKKYLREGKYLKVRKIIEGVSGKTSIKASEPKNLTFNPENDSWDDKNYGSVGLDGIFQKLLPTPIFIKAMPTEEELEKIINTILRTKAEKSLEDKELEELRNARGAILKLQEKMYNPGAIAQYKDAVNEQFQKVFPDTKIDFEDIDNTKYTSDKLGKKFKIHFEKLDEDGSPDENIPSSHASIGHGAVRTAIFALLLMQDVADEYEREGGRKDFLVLFEEPELFLHPKLMRELRDLIYKVSDDEYPYQVLCASHSPQMIDISKPKSSLVRMALNEKGTEVFQVDETYLKDASKVATIEELKNEMYEVLRFNPHICEAFYSDEVILVEGPTEEIIIRGYFSEKIPERHFFVVNCGTVNNIPFYQRIFSKFFIKYNIICDTDEAESEGEDDDGVIVFLSGIQKSIYEQFKDDSNIEGYEIGLFRVHHPSFEPAHQTEGIDENLRIDEPSGQGKPYDANIYWKTKLSPNINDEQVNQVPIIKNLDDIVTS